MSNDSTITTQEEFQAKVKASKGLVVVALLASWHEPCQQATKVVSTLAKEHPFVDFLKVDVEEVDGVGELFDVESVPTFVLMKGNAIVARQEGADIPALVSLVAARAKSSANIVSELDTKAQAAPAPKAPSVEDLNQRLSKLVKAAPVMLFMKGSPSSPKCGFSRTIIGLLNDQKIVFSSFDILTDNAVRQGLKTFSNWKTFPQLYINGELVGGLDVVREMIEDGELKDMIPAAPKEEDLNDKIKRILTSEKIMIFIKGSPETPKCGFSRTAVGILDSIGEAYGHFDILLDNDVRQGLKKYSNWPTYPQLYVNGELVGGLDVLREMDEDDELATLLSS